MDSHYPKNGNSTGYDPGDYNNMNIDEFTRTFKDSLDVLNSIKEISKMREKAGLVDHSYNVKIYFPTILTPP